MASKEEPTETDEDFKARIGNMMTSGFLSIGVALGSASGLFHAMSRLGKPASCSEIAREANKKERYVREWLASMATAKIVDYDPDKETYFMSPTRLQTLIGGKEHGNIDRVIQMIPNICLAYDEILHCMEPDGPAGVPYSVYKAFHGVIDGISSLRFEGGFPVFLSNMEDLKTKLDSGITVCDIGCGVGRDVFDLAKAFPKSTFHGVDIAERIIQEAQIKADESDLSNLTYHCQDATKLPEDWSDKFDLVLSTDSLHDQARPDLALKEFHKVLKSEGYLIIIDINSHTKLGDNLNNPSAPLLYTVSLMHCMPVSLYFDGGLGYGTMWGMEKLIALIDNAKLTCERHFPLEGTAERVFICRKIL